MEHTLLYDCFLNKFFKDYEHEFKPDERIEQSIAEIKNLLPEDKQEKVLYLKIDMINFLQDLEVEHLKHAMDFGILVGIELQQTIDQYIEENS